MVQPTLLGAELADGWARSPAHAVRSAQRLWRLTKVATECAAHLHLVPQFHSRIGMLTHEHLKYLRNLAPSKCIMLVHTLEASWTIDQSHIVALKSRV